MDPLQGPWSVSEETVRGEVVVTRGNEGLAKRVGDERFAALVTITMPYRGKRANGQPNGDEQCRLKAFEEVLAISMCEDGSTLFAGTATGGGLRDFHFYSARPERSRRIFQRILELMCCPMLQFSIEDDPSWATFRRRLCPSRGLDEAKLSDKMRG